MIPVTELIEWLKQFKPDDGVGVGEGGLDLKIVRGGKLLKHSCGLDEYYEIGGIPEELER